MFENPSGIKRKKLPKGPSTTQYLDGIVADQLSNMAAKIIGSRKEPSFFCGKWLLIGNTFLLVRMQFKIKHYLLLNGIIYH